MNGRYPPGAGANRTRRHQVTQWRAHFEDAQAAASTGVLDVPVGSRRGSERVAPSRRLVTGAAIRLWLLPGHGHHENLHPGIALIVASAPGATLTSHFRVPFMIVKDFVPMSEIRPFAIMRNVAATPVSARSRGGRGADGSKSRCAGRGSAHHASLFSQRSSPRMLTHPAIAAAAPDQPCRRPAVLHPQRRAATQHPARHGRAPPGPPQHPGRPTGTGPARPGLCPGPQPRAQARHRGAP
jgi:hypothetical protein